MNRVLLFQRVHVVGIKLDIWNQTLENPERSTEMFELVGFWYVCPVNSFGFS